MCAEHNVQPIQRYPALMRLVPNFKTVGAIGRVVFEIMEFPCTAGRPPLDPWQASSHYDKPGIVIRIETPPLSQLMVEHNPRDSLKADGGARCLKEGRGQPRAIGANGRAYRRPEEHECRQ